MKRQCWAFIALLFVGCVDNSIDLENVETTVGINCNELTLPLAYLESKSLGEIFGNELENITADPVTGDYSFSFSDDSNVFEIKGSGNNFVIPGYMYKVDIDYPSFKLSDVRYLINERCTVGGSYMGIDMEFVEGHMVNIPAGIEVSGQVNGVLDYDFDIPVPEFVERIDKVYVEHDSHLPGAPIEAVLDLGSLSSVNAGGTVSVEIVVPDGYEIYGEDKQPIVGNTFKIDARKFNSYQHRVTFTCYVGSIENHQNAEGGVIHIPNQIEYRISYSLATRAANITLDELPFFEINSEMACEDAEVTLSAKNILPAPLKIENKISVDAMNDYVGTLKRIDLLNSTIKFKIDGLDWWSDEAVASGILDNIFVEATLPFNFDIYVETDGVQFDRQHSMLRTTLAQLKRGVKIGVNSIDFGSGLSVGEGGKVEADMSFTINAGLEQGTAIRLKHLQHEGDASFYAGFEESRVLVTSVSGRVDYSYVERMSFDLSELAVDEKLQIDASGLHPVIELMLNNSISVPLQCSAQIVPHIDDQPVDQNVINVGPINIYAAQIGSKYPDYTPAKTVVRIGENLRQQEGVQCVECDLANILNGTLPDKVDVELKVSSYPDQDVTLLLLPSYPIEYGYSFGLPLSFNSSLDWSYSDVFTGLGGTFSTIDDQIDAVLDIELICEVTNSTPLSVSLDLELLDVDGNRSPIAITSPGHTTIAGSKDGVTPAHSTCVLKVDMSKIDNAIAELKRIDGLRYSLRVTSAADGVALNKNQAIGADFKLKINGNINVEL